VADPERSPLRFARAFRAVGWLLSAGGVVYLYLGLRGLAGGGSVSAPLVILGLIAIVVGTALVRWGTRKLTP
jgi:hypothetical protein